MGLSRKGLYRLALLILLIPVVLVLFLHFFGENRMSVEMKTPLVDCGLDNGETTVHITKAELITELDQKNQLARVVKILKRKQVPLDTSNYTCFGDTLSLLVIDRKNNLRGSYLLEHSDINRMFVELDIVKLQENYGREVSR